MTEKPKPRDVTPADLDDLRVGLEVVERARARTPQERDRLDCARRSIKLTIAELEAA